MNRAEQEALIIKYRYLVRSVAYSVSNEAAKDEDALQNGLIGLWEATKKWDGNRPFEPLARRCIRCNIIDYIRSIHPDDSLEEDIPSEENIAALQSYEDQDFLALVYKLFPRRSRERRVLLALMRGESKPVIAAKLGCSRQTVYTISRAAWQKLQVEAEQEAQGR